MEFVSHSLQGRPVGTQAVVVKAKVGKNLVKGVHGERSEVVTQRVLGGVGDHVDGGMAVHVDCRYGVLLCGLRVEQLKALNGHRVDGMSDRLVEVRGKTFIQKFLVADIGRQGHGQTKGQHQHGQGKLHLFVVQSASSEFVRVHVRV